MKKSSLILSILMLICIGVSLAQVAKSGYRIANKICLEGDGGWDYLTIDDATSRLYISHGTIVQILDVNEKKVVGTIPDTKGVHGIALAKDINKGFISNGRDTSVTVFDLKTLQFITKVKVTGNNPDAILYDPFSHKVFTFNGRSSNSTVIDANSNKVIGTIELPGKPEFSVTDAEGKVYVNIEDKSLVCLISPMTLKIEKTWSVAPGEEPSGLAIDIKDHRLFVVCGNKLMIVLDADNGTVVSKLDIGDRVDGVAFDPILKRIYSSNGEGTMTVVQQENKDSYKVTENFPTQKGARTITLNPKTHRIYLSTAEFGPAPAATTENPRPRPSAKANTFMIIEIEPM
ncbi:MAG: YncE family protein [Bacteroidales bacterium]|jgi:DNA-binding beta-propeller fold protein YncE|nr:YncE family protein [Bacteroidales bacterium]